MPESSCSFSWVHRAPFCNGDVTPREKTFDLRILNRSWRTNDILPFRSRPWQAPSNFCPGSALSLKHEITQKKKEKEKSRKSWIEKREEGKKKMALTKRWHCWPRNSRSWSLHGLQLPKLGNTAVMWVQMFLVSNVAEQFFKKTREKGL